MTNSQQNAVEELEGMVDTLTEIIKVNEVHLDSLMAYIRENEGCYACKWGDEEEYENPIECETCTDYSNFELHSRAYTNETD